LDADSTVQQSLSPEEAPTMQIPTVPAQSPVSPEDAPTMQIPQVRPVQSVDPDLEPTARIPEPPRQDVGPDLLYSGVPRPSKPAAQAEQPSKPRRSGARIGMILGIVAGALVLALVLGVFVYGVVLKNGDTIYPNVYVAGINVGGMKRQQAIAAVDEAVAASYASATLKVQLPDRTLSFSPEQTNVALDADEAIDEALSYGRDGNPFSAVTGYFSCRTREHYIDLQTILNLDTDYIRQYIDQVAAEVAVDPVETKVRYDEAAQALIVDVGYPDRKLDAEGLFEVVCNAFTNGDFEPLSWDFDEIPCQPADLKPYYEKYCTEAQDAYYDEETKTLVEEVVGFGFDLEDALQTIANAASGSQVTIPLGDVSPEVTLEVLDKELFGTTLFETSTEYVINANRTENLRLACEAIDGLILNPGDVFSFNEVVGERTAEKGYKPATVYSGGQSLEELGGGVCQVASTLYYATLHLNMEQVHREPHQFVVTYVPKGMDATVYWGHIDYQFRNTLSNPVRILANTDNGSVNVTFQGIKENDETVKMDFTILETYPWQEVEEVDETKPVGYRQVDVTPYTGYKVITYKTILDADGNQISRTEEAYSTYSKRDQKVIVGPTEEPFDPELWPGEDDEPLWPDWGYGDSDEEEDNGFTSDEDETEDNTTQDAENLNPWS